MNDRRRWSGCSVGRSAVDFRGTLGQHLVDLGRQAPPDGRSRQPFEVVRVVIGQAADRPAGIAAEVDDTPRALPVLRASAAQALPGATERPARGGHRRWRLVRDLLRRRLGLGVVGGAASLVTENGPGLVDGHHALGVATEVRVMLTRQHPVRRPDDVRFGPTMDLEHLIEVVHGLTVSIRSGRVYLPLGWWQVVDSPGPDASCTRPIARTVSR